MTPFRPQYQKHWTNEKEIIRAIEAAHRKQAELCALGEKRRLDGDECAKKASDELLYKEWERGTFLTASREAYHDARLFFEKASRIDRRLQTLKRTLAAFRTDTLFGIVEDVAVVTQR